MNSSKPRPSPPASPSPDGSPSQHERRGFTLTELLIAVAILSTLSAVGYLGFSNTTEAVRANKLASDVVALNAAVRTYIISGGDFTSVRNGHEVISKLKTVASASQRTKIAGLRASMIDQRLRGIETTAQGIPRAVWDDSKKTFFVQTTGDGFREFLLDENDSAALITEFRSQAMDLNSKDKWIWGYGENAATNRPAAPALTGNATDAPPPSSVDRILTQLQPPTFSAVGGSYSLRSFDLPLALNNPNPPRVSQILYSLNGGMELIAALPLSIPPNSVVTAYTTSRDPDNWVGSSTSSASYTVSPVLLSLALGVPKLSVTYAEVGGAMLAGTVPPAAASPATLTLVNSADIPAAFQNSSIFSIVWTYDGSDPLTSGTAVTGSSFTNGFPGQNVATTLDKWGTGTFLPIRAAAKGLNPALVTSSPVVAATLTPNPITLRAPLIAKDAASAQMVISLNSYYSDMPPGTRVYYTTDGQDPGVLNGNPVTGTLYSGAFASSASCTGSSVKARVYPPTNLGLWFTTSPVSSYSLPGPINPFELLVCQYRKSRLCTFGALLTGSSLSISHSESGVDGGLSMASGVVVGSAAGAVTRGFFVDPANPSNPKGLDNVFGSGGTLLTPIPDSAIPQMKVDAFALNASALALNPTQTFSTLGNGSVVNGTAPDGFNVISVGTISLSGGSTFTINGTANDWFVFNISTELVTSGGSMVYAPGLDPSRILFNFAPGAKKIRFSGGSMLMQGTVLAPHTSADLTGGSKMVGSAVLGGSVTLTGGSQIIQTTGLGGCDDCCGGAPPTANPVDTFVSNFVTSNLGRFGWFSTGGTVDLSGWDAGVIGNVGVAKGTLMNYTKGFITGQFVVDPSVTQKNGAVDTTPGATAGPVISAVLENLDFYKSAAVSLSAQAAALSPTQTFGTINNTAIISSTAPNGKNVIALDGISLGSGKSLTINGGPNDYFIFNISTVLKFTGATMVVSNGVPGSHILFNLLPGASSVQISGAALTIDATILAPTHAMDLSGTTTVTGSLISGAIGKLSGDAVITQTAAFGY